MRPKRCDEQVADARAESGLRDGARKQERGEHQPDRDVAEPRQHSCRRQRTGQRQQRHGEQDADAHADRLRDERNDGRDEDGEQAPLRRIQPGQGKK